MHSLDSIGPNHEPPLFWSRHHWNDFSPTNQRSAKRSLRRSIGLKTTSPTQNKLILPAVYHGKSGKLKEINFEDSERLPKYLQRELDLSRLERIHHYFWLAGRPSVSARDLHRQRNMRPSPSLAGFVNLSQADARIPYHFWTKHLCQDEVLGQFSRISPSWLQCLYRITSGLGRHWVSQYRSQITSLCLYPVHPPSWFKCLYRITSGLGCHWESQY